jgi:O-antigen/teichoic acid export membrane protein
VTLEQAAPRVSLARGGSLVAPALTFVNVVGYVVTVAAARALDKDAYGELVALLGALLVGVVPSLAIQAVVARAIARRPEGELPGARERALILRAAVLGAAVTVVAAAVAPLLAVFLHTPVAGPLWVAVQLIPFAVMSALMGVLQGAERFGALAVVIVFQAVGKLVGLVPLLLDGSAADVLAALAGGALLTVVLGLAVVGLGAPGAVSDLPRLPDVARATSGLLALLVIANLDVLLARNVLSGDESGRYSAGAVLAKAAFWLPQAVAVVVFPRLADPEAGKALLRRSVAVVGVLGALEVAGCLLLAKPVLEITFGTSYGSLSSIAWLWVVQGAALSVVQLLIYRAIATHDRVTGRVVGAAAAAEALLVLGFSPSTPGPVIALATGVAVVLTGGLLIRSLAR